MALPSLYWLDQAGKFFSRCFPVVGTLAGVLSFVLEIGDLVVAGALNFMIDRIDALDTSAFSEVGFGAVASIGYANAIFPIEELIGVWIAVYTAIGTILVLRWVKSFVPTIAN